MEKGRKSRSNNKPWIISALLVASAVLPSCSSSSKPSTTPESAAAPTTLLPAALPNLPPPPPIREVAASAPRAVKVISDGTEGNAQPSLIEASRMAKAKKRNEGESRPSIEITDENLKEYSNGGQVFVLEAGDGNGAGDPQAIAPAAEPSATAGAADSQPQVYAGETAGESDKELFWRQSVSELRTALRQTVDDLKRIELESTLLRQQFYSESDPFVRDSEVKPRWDRALDQLGFLRKKAKQDREALSSLLNEAKKAGIAAEWLGESTSADLTEEEIRLINGTPAAAKP